MKLDSKTSSDSPVLLLLKYSQLCGQGKLRWRDSWALCVSNDSWTWSIWSECFSKNSCLVSKKTFMQVHLEQRALPRVCKSQQWRLPLLELSKGAVCFSCSSTPSFWIKWDSNSWVKGPPFLWAWGTQAPFSENVSREENTSVHIQFHARTIIPIESLEEVLVWGAGVWSWLVLMSECQEVMAWSRFKFYKRSHWLPRWKFRVSKRSLSDKKFPF